MFQSLLCWIMVCKGTIRRNLCTGRQFQSLLCWIMVCKRLTECLRNAIFRSFNPCYVGLWSVSSFRGWLLSKQDVFQSLLCWIMVCKYLLKKSIIANTMFQSLLCWIMVCKTQNSSFQAGRKGVSILVMLDYGL